MRRGKKKIKKKKGGPARGEGQRKKLEPTKHLKKKKTKKKSTNGESLNRTHCFCYEKIKTPNIQCYMIWDKRPNLNPKPNFKPFYNLYGL